MTAKVLIEQVRSTFEQLPDVRKGGPNQRYAMPDAALSAFAVFFTQSPSFLDYQERMQKDKGRNNASALFGVHQIPSDPQIRNLLDPVDPAHLAPLFIDTGGCQASCRKKFDAQAIFWVSWFWFFCVSGLRWTSAIRSQLRVGPDQRFGLASRAAAYTLARSSRSA